MKLKKIEFTGKRLLSCLGIGYLEGISLYQPPNFLNPFHITSQSRPTS